MNRNIIVIGASAGGIAAVQEILSGLSGDLPAALFVVVHCAPESPGYLARILDDAGPLPAAFAIDGKAIRNGQVHVAPPDLHLLLRAEEMSVMRGPKENRSRPAIDPLFRSAALNHEHRVIGVILSGMLDDGAAGLAAIKQCGGIAVVQDPRDAAYPAMSEAALLATSVDYCVPLKQIAGVLRELAHSEAIPHPLSEEGKDRIRAELASVEQKAEGKARVERLGRPSSLVCPECNGSLWEIEDENLLRYRCHIGHAYSSASLALGHDEAVERALQAALRGLEDTITMAGRLAEEGRKTQRPLVTEIYERRVKEAGEHATLLRGILSRKPVLPTGST